MVNINGFYRYAITLVNTIPSTLLSRRLLRKSVSDLVNQGISTARGTASLYDQ